MKLMITIILLFISMSLYLEAQYPPCDTNYNGNTFSFDKLTYVPPLSVDMPLDVLLGYIVVDSARHNGRINLLEEFLSRQSYNDTIRYIMRFFYQMIDYNPINFTLYSRFGDYHPCPLPLMKEKVLERILEIAPNYGDFLLLFSDYIAHIEVTDTVTTYYNGEGIYNRSVIVTSEILDTIKGRVIPECVYFNPPEAKKDEKDSKLSLPGECIQFSYGLDWPRGKSDMDDGVIDGNDGYPWTGIRPKLLDTAGIPWVVKSREYIVFLNFTIICIDKDNDIYYYTLFPCGGDGSMTYGMYPVIDGKVLDPENEFGFGTDLSVADFKTVLRNRIQSIINYGK